ncbi:hypothetical protein MTP03_06170 [Tsukamurella sp. PLM1]|nr:hypothetical protein MTP03_06170 [Tsukamurella sp. PLM1]
MRRRRDEADRRRQYVELTDEGRAVIEDDRAVRNAWLEAAMAERLTPLERDVLLLAAPVLVKLADRDPGPRTGGSKADAKPRE